MPSSRKLVPPPDDFPEADFPPLTGGDPNAFEKLQASTPRHRRIFNFLVLDLTEHVASRLQELGKNARWLAQKLGKTDSEISRWLSGTHNLTLESVAKLSDALDEDLLVSPRFPMGFFGEVAPALVVETSLSRLIPLFSDLDRRGGAVAYDVLSLPADSYGISYAMAA